MGLIRSGDNYQNYFRYNAGGDNHTRYGNVIRHLWLSVTNKSEINFEQNAYVPDTRKFYLLNR
jgi:hypothetical protein